MSSDYDRWRHDGLSNSWAMPPVSRWRRLPIIRHLRAVYGAWRAEQFYEPFSRMGMLNTGYDRWVVSGIWNDWSLSP